MKAKTLVEKLHAMAAKKAIKECRLEPRDAAWTSIASPVNQKLQACLFYPIAGQVRDIRG